jgi:acyl dehydratase
MSEQAELDALITDEMRACIGRTSPAQSLPEEISASDVRRYVQAVGDDNPLWRDDELARRVGYRGRRVPHLLITQLRWRLGDRSSEDLLESDWSGLVYPEGFTNFRHAGQEVEWFAPVYVGDTLTFQNRLVDIFVRRGRNGPIIFTKTEGDIRNQDGVLVARTTTTGARMRAARFSEAATVEA